MKRLKTVHLSLYKLGKDGKLHYDSEGKVVSEKTTVKLPHDTVEWKNFKRQMLRNGFSKFEVSKILEFEKRDEDNKAVYNDVTSKFKSEIEAELNEVIQPLVKSKSLEGGSSAKLDALEKQNALLMKRLEQLEKGGSNIEQKEAPNKEVDSSNGSEDESLEGLREEFQKLYGVEPDKRFKAKKLQEAIDKKK